MEHSEQNAPPKRRLGRGINAMFGAAPDAPQQDTPSDSTDHGTENKNFRMVPVGEIERNPFQPRTEFDPVALDELADSIRKHGVLQPLLVRPVENGFQLIAGERRLLASRKAGIPEVPCQIRDADDQAVTEQAIEENLKREDLNALEKAVAFNAYLEKFGCTVEDLSAKLSMTRSAVANLIRLLDLPSFVQDAVRNEDITYGHARALLPLEQNEQVLLCQRIIEQGLSVRKTEQTVRAVMRGEAKAEGNIVPFKKPDTKPEPSNHILSLQEQLRNALGAPVEIKQSGAESGKIVIAFKTNQEFERLLALLRPAA